MSAVHHLQSGNVVILKICHAFRIWTGLRFVSSPVEHFAGKLVCKEKKMGNTGGELIHMVF